MRVLRTTLLIIALIAAALLLVGALATYWEPADLINIVREQIAWTAIVAGLALAWAGRRRVPTLIFACMAALLGAACLIPPARPAACAQGQPGIRLLWYNLGSADRLDLERTVDWIRSQDADIIGLAEAKAGDRSAIIARLRPDYPAVQSCLRDGRCSTLLLSRLPIQSSSALARGDPENRKALSAVTMTLARPRVTLAAIHLSWPLPMGKQRTELGELFTATGADPRLIVMGDFNMPETMRAFADFLEWTGLRAADPGRATWPLRLGARRTTPLLGIDHLLLGDAWGLRSVHALDGAGSDHRGLVADVCPL